MDSLGLLGGRRQLMLGGVRRPTLGSDLVPSFSAPLTTGLGAAAWGSGTPTFTRATVAYVQDWEGLLKPVLSGEARFTGARRVRNLVLAAYANDLNTSWTKSNATSVSGASDPDGGTNAYTVTATGATGAWYNTFSESGAERMTSSIWVKRRTGTGTIAIIGADGIDVAITSVLSTSWQRFSVVDKAATGSAGYIGIRITTSGDAVDIYKPQLENVTGQSNRNPSEYVSVGVLSAPYHGANVDGVKYFDTLNGNTVASNVVTEATGVPIVTGAAGVSALTVDSGGPFGYLAEGARSDVLGTTNAIRRDMSSASWVATSITKSTGTGADGTASAAARLTASGANGTALFTTVLAAAVRTYSAWVRRVTGSGTINMTVDNGVTWTPITLTTAYKQFQVTTANVANPIIGFQIVTSGDAIEVDFNQLEAATYATSPIDVATATRNADALTYPTAGNVSATEGSAYCEFTLLSTGVVTNLEYLAVSAIGLPLYSQGATSRASIYDGANSSVQVGAITANTAVKSATRWSAKSSTMKAFASGSGTSGAFDGSLTPDASMTVGGNIAGTSAGQKYIRNLRIYPRAFDDAQLQAMVP